MIRPHILTSQFALSSAMLVFVFPGQVHAKAGGAIFGLGTTLADTGLSVGAIIGIVVGVIACFCCSAFCYGVIKGSKNTPAADDSVYAVHAVPYPMTQTQLATPWDATAASPSQPQQGGYYPPMSPLPTAMGNVASPESAQQTPTENNFRVVVDTGIEGHADLTTATTTGTAAHLPIGMNISSTSPTYPLLTTTQTDVSGSSPDTPVYPTIHHTTEGTRGERM